ncbi:MAG: HAMP domain-containing histidine kinase [Candidatus Krumholzibacteria bacterium]|nr:HAMP domain-containing histidine kinase [Candidatus Krumholzibacteria bacterium]
MIGQFSNYRGNLRFWLKIYLIVGAGILVVCVLLYTSRVIQRMEAQSAATTRLFSRFVAEVVFQVEDVGKRSILQDVIREINLPIVITDVEGRPIAWHRVGIPAPADEDFNELLNVDPQNPPPGKIGTLVALSRKFDKTNRPVPIRLVGSTEVQGFVHFGPSKLQQELRLMPLTLLVLFLLFMGVALQGFRSLKLSEQRSIWVGLAKETAHQLGTPLSALLGWTQLLKDQLHEDRKSDAIGSVVEMEEDLKRLSKVTERFSKIGSRPELRRVDLAPVLDRTVKYFHRRLPRLKAESTITLEIAEIPPIRGNEELLEWVFENLIRNGLDALGEKGGRIEIRARHDVGHRRVDIFVKDSGRGVPAGLRQRIFSPGFTTKRRGWGLGLALTRRIVQDYHGGEIRLTESHLGAGSTFVVRFPTA